MKIYIAPHPTEGFNYLWTCPRGEAIVRDGLLSLPDVELVDDERKADFVIWDYVPHNKGQKTRELIDRYNPDKLVVIDWIDEPHEYHTEKYFAYFKRSWVHPTVGMPHFCPAKEDRGRPPRMFPFAYAVMDGFLGSMVLFRGVSVGCYLRWTCPNRNVVKSFMANFRHKDHSALVGEPSEGSRSVYTDVYFDDVYFGYLRTTNLLVTCNPTWWEGDSRTWEALANGCLVFVDKTFTPYPDRPQHGQHWIEYDLADLSTLDKALRYYLDHPDEAAQIAIQGRKFALEKHSPAARMRYVVDTIKELS